MRSGRISCSRGGLWEREIECDSPRARRRDDRNWRRTDVARRRRISSVHKAKLAGHDTTGAVLGSDAFFPFRDGVDQAAEAGITAIIQPGGSVKDEEVIAAADEHDRDGVHRPETVSALSGMVDRRGFVAAAAGAIVGLPAVTAIAQREDDRGIGKIGLQLYTVRGLMKENMARTLAEVAQAGYSEVEFAGYFNHPAREVRRMLDDTGLTSPSAHRGNGRHRRRVGRVSRRCQHPRSEVSDGHLDRCS